MITTIVKRDGRVVEFNVQKIADAISYAKELKDRYTVLWLHYDLFGGEEA